MPDNDAPAAERARNLEQAQRYLDRDENGRLVVRPPFNLVCEIAFDEDGSDVLPDSWHDRICYLLQKPGDEQMLAVITAMPQDGSAQYEEHVYRLTLPAAMSTSELCPFVRSAIKNAVDPA